MSAALTPPVTIRTGAVPEGKVADFLTGRHVKDTPEEYVRQNLAKALVRQYKYDPRDCEPEFPIRIGSSRRRVDIAVFEPGAPHVQDNVLLIVETKRPGTNSASRTDGIEQLRSYIAACMNATYGMWSNGDEQYCFAKRSDGRGGYTSEEIIDIPGFGQSEADAQRPKRKDLRPATADNLLFAFRRCHNYIAGTEGKQKTEAFWELLKLIFCKIEDERSRQLDFYVTASERIGGAAAGSAKTRIQKLFNDKVLGKYPSIFAAGDTAIDLRPTVIAYVVSQLQGYSLLASPVDVKGVAYEEIVGSNLRGDRGEFFTPRNACRMAVAMLDPQPDQRLIDPACGTGGFLITGMNHALAIIDQEQRSNWGDAIGTDEERQELYNARREYLSSCVFGLDLNPGLVRAAKMNMVMNNDGSGGLWQANSLAHPQTWSGKAAQRVPLGSIDVLVANPPFGANIVIDDVEILEQYELAGMWDRQEAGNWALRRNRSGRVVLQKNQPPEILFIERCVQLLKPGTGRFALVIPNGILNNPALGYVRTWLMQNTQILAVVDMARELFQPKNDTQTSMVLARRLSVDECEAAQAGKLDYSVFMAVAEKIGQDKRGNVLYRRTETGDDVLVVRTETISEIDPGTGEEVPREVAVEERLIDDELPDVAVAYRRWLDGQK